MSDRKAYRKKVEKRLLVFFAFAGLGPVIFYSLKFWSHGELSFNSEHTLVELLFSSIFSVFITVSISYVVMKTIYWLQKVLPWRKSIAKRLIAEFFLTSGISVSMVIIYRQLMILAFPMEAEFNRSAMIFEGISTAMIMNFILTSIIEGVFLFDDWKRSIIRAEQLERVNMQSQMDMLKHQVNPHFLFNSLNVLSSLVRTDIDKADEFIDEFARVYRYILEVDTGSLATISDEMTITSSYLFLHKIRFSEALKWETSLSEEVMGNHIPGLSLQLLVENAIKHNIISSQSPLIIKIFNEDGWLIVENNNQPRKDKSTSTGIGQINLLKRYELLTNKVPIFIETKDLYTSKIPILKQI